MLNGKKIVVVLPAFNAAGTLARTFSEIPFHLVDDVILTDDASVDDTVRVAQELGIQYILTHSQNRGYGANQKTCYAKALELGADIIVMLHPDYQYSPKLIPVMVQLVADDVFPVVLGSRILGKGALSGGMPLYKYMANRALTFIQNIACGSKLSEFHTGFRVFDARVLKHIRYELNSDDFVFDNQVLSQVLMAGYSIGEVTSPAKYFPEASSINFNRSMVYGFGVLRTCLQHVLHRNGAVIFQRYQVLPPNQS